MPTASNGNGHSSNGVIPISESGTPLVLGGMAIAGSPLDVAELERLANEMFRAGPEGAGLAPDTPDLPEMTSESVIDEVSGAPDRPSGMPAGAPPVPELMEWSDLTVGAVPSSPGRAPAAGPEMSSGAPAPPMPMPTFAGDPSPAAGTDLFALQGERLSLAELGLVEVPRVIAADPATGSYYFMDESRSFASPEASSGGATLPASPASGYPAFDVEAVRRDFPVPEHVHGGLPLVWLDNAATTQKPTAVMSRLDYFYSHENSNVHRAAHEMAARATDAYEAARDKVARFLHAPSSEEIVFVRGATEAINLVAQAWGRQNVRAGDEM